MTIDAGTLRADLLEARRARDAHAARAIGSLLTSLANAEAVPVADDRYRVAEGSGEAPRRELTTDDVADILAAEIDERRRAIEEYRRIGADTAALEAEVAVLDRYRGGPEGSPGSAASAPVTGD
jgi:uncharacterized protein YqeY